jgi:pyocin large subunit-like protein
MAPRPGINKVNLLIGLIAALVLIAAAASLIINNRKDQPPKVKQSGAIARQTATFNGQTVFKGGFAPGELDANFAAHGAEFGSETPEAYLAAAQALIARGLAGAVAVQTFTRADGALLIYDPAKNQYAAVAKDGTILVYLKPAEGYDYWLEQSEGG